MNRFDKFAWLKMLQSDPALSDTDFRLGVRMCTTFTRADGFGWLVELDTLAASLPQGLSRNRLNASLRRLIESGYLAETGRTGGGRGVTAKRSHQLVTPGKPLTHPVVVSGQTPTAPGWGFGVKTPTASGENPNRQRLKPQPLAVDQIRPDLQKGPPTETLEGTLEGGARARGPYGPRCPAHFLDPHPPPCRPCGEAREADEAQQLAAHRADDARTKRIRDAIDSCTRCDNYGRLDDLSDCPNHPNFRQLARSTS